VGLDSHVDYGKPRTTSKHSDKQGQAGHIDREREREGGKKREEERGGGERLKLLQLAASPAINGSGWIRCCIHG